MANQNFGNLVKAVIDIEKRVLVINEELHADLEHFLLEQGSRQQNLWGINLHPDRFEMDDFIEYDSMINLRPNHANMSRGVDNPAIRNQIHKIVTPLFHK
jgi:hypothetical protein